MSTKEAIQIGSVEIDVIRKNIKNMHLAVYPPKGNIRLSVPEQTDHEVARLFAISKLSWIKKQVKTFKDQPRETERKYISGESHYFMGKRYMLNVIERYGKHEIVINGTKKMIMYVHPNTSQNNRAEVLKEWYRDQLKNMLPDLISKWESIMQVECNDWGVKYMKTKWGTCNIEAKRIWLNLELAKKPPICLEYIVVHELVHLFERHHNDRFVALMDKFMPKWRLHRDELNTLPVAHVEWGY